MGTFKTNVYDMCSDVAADFPGWKFGAGQFKNNSLKHTSLVVHLGFGFEHDTTPVYPSVSIYNKRLSKLCKDILGVDGCASIVSMQTISHTLQYTPERLRAGFWIVQDKSEYLLLAKPSQAVIDVTVDITEARAAVFGTMKDAISFIENHYDLSSEDAFLRGLPAKYATRHENSPYDQWEKMNGVMICLIRLLLGDFDFVEKYRSADFKTIYPKRIADLDKIVASLPELKRRFSETGSVI